MARIIFDLDGTLIDSVTDIHGIANAVLQAENLPTITIETARSFIGNGAQVFVARLRALYDIPDTEQDRLYDAFVSRYDTAVELTQTYPGVKAALEGLRAAGHQLGICTNKPISPTRAILNHLKLTPLFQTIWGGDSLPVHKPDPAPLHAAFDALGTEGHRIFVGDSGVDAETAQNAKVPFLLFTEGYRKTSVENIPHDRRFSKWSAFLSVLEDVQPA